MEADPSLDPGAGTDSKAGTEALDPLVVVETESRKPQHMAFTIHFADANLNSATTKFIQNKVCNYTPKHRRNLPTTEENKTVKTEAVNSVQATHSLPPIASLNVGTIPSGHLGTTRRAGYHSEGYFSSDQDEDIRNRSGFFVRKLKSLDKGFRTTNLAQEKKIMADQTSQSKLHNSPHMRRHEFGDFPVEEFTHKSRLEELKCLNNAANNVGTLNAQLDEDLSKDEWLLAATSEDVTLTAEEIVEDEDVEFSDMASEAGTYTIDRDAPCLEEEQARQAIARVVEEKLDATLEADADFKMSSYRNGTNWINDWATQVAKHNHPPEPPEPPDHVVSGLPPLPIDKHKAPSSLTTRIPSPIRGASPTLPPSGRRNAPTSPSRHPRSPHHSAGDRTSDSSLETESYLRATETLVTAMQARMSLSVDSGGESDAEMTPVIQQDRVAGDSHVLQRRSSGVSDTSVRRSNHKTLQSDSSSENSEAKTKKEESAPLMRYNRAFSLRRARLDCDPIPVARPLDSRAKKSEPAPTPVYKPHTPVESVRLQTRTTKASSPKHEPAKVVRTEATKPEVAKTFSRTDCGRFSVRTTKASSQPPPSKPSPVVKKEVKKDGKKVGGGRSNSSLSSREVDFQNWKRRKSYDPMKAAAEGKKKDAAKKATFNTSMTQSYTTAEELSPSHSQQNSVLRSASFHGTMGLAPKYTSSEEEAALSGEEDEDLPTMEHMSYTCALPPVAGSPTKSSTEGALGGSRVSLHSTGTASNSSMKGRTRPEALDSLVMAALSGLSHKLRGRSCLLLKKLRYLYEEDIDKSEQLSAIIDVLDAPTNPGSPLGKSPSRELSDTLKNLKRLESVITVLDEVLFDDEDFEDLKDEQFQ